MARAIIFGLLLVFAAVVHAAKPVAKRTVLAEKDKAEVASIEKQDLTGAIHSVGSDTMSLLIARWSEAFMRQHAQVSIGMESKGSGTAAEALIVGRSQIAPMSRSMTAAEIATFNTRYGYPPLGIRVALDAVVVIVNPSNPLSGLTMEQLDGMFSAKQKCGGKPLQHWGELIKNWKTDPILVVGRNKVSGTYDFFRSHALCGGDFAGFYKEEENSNSVVHKVATDPSSIGYVSLGYLSPNVKLLPLARNADQPLVSAISGDPKLRSTGDPNKLFAEVASGHYPLSRFLYVYANKAPSQPLPGAIDAFLRYVLSKDGQEIAHASGFIPLSSNLASEQLKKLEASYAEPWFTGD